MFKGTDRVASGELSRIVSRNGGRDNAYTTFDSTGYHQTIAVAQLELVMRMEADRMVNSRVDRKDLDSEMTVVRNEFERGENSPQRVLEELNGPAERLLVIDNAEDAESVRPWLPRESRSGCRTAASRR